MTAFEPPAGAITITFPQPAALLNMNDREHWRPRSAKVRNWRATTWAWALKAHRATGTVGHFAPSFVMLTIDVPDKRRRDAANLTPCTKACVDGLVDAELWPDDTPDWVTTLEPRLRHSPDRLVTIHIWPRDGAA